MFCPQCHAEYREGFVECADCHIPLVDRLPDAPAEAGEGDLDALILTGFAAAAAAAHAAFAWQRVYCGKPEYLSLPWTKMQGHARKAGISSVGGACACRAKGKPRPARFCRAWKK